jgi:hypothetical protein
VRTEAEGGGAGFATGGFRPPAAATAPPASAWGTGGAAVDHQTLASGKSSKLKLLNAKACMVRFNQDEPGEARIEPSFL